MKTAIVCEGGGMRGAFTAGVLEYFMEQELWADELIGVSAGASGSISYVSRQKDRCRATMMDYLDVEPYVSLKSLVKTGFLFNMDFLFDRLPNQLNQFDYDTFYQNPCQFYAGATDVETGKIHFFSKEDLTPKCEMLRASCALPMISRLVKVKDRYYLDGGIADSIPYQKAIEDGCERIIVILTRPRDYQKKPQSGKTWYRRKYRKYPNLIYAIEHRHEMYNRELSELRRLEKEGRVIVIAPRQKLDLTKFERDQTKLQKAYEEGRECARIMLEQLEQ